MPKVWYVAILGRPNAGKSTFINALIGEKVSVISPRPQTTQRSVTAIFTDTEKEQQIIFLDTPGIHEVTPSEGKSPNMNERINAEAFASLREADIVMRLIDPTRPQWREDERIDEVLGFINKPVIRVETKQDLKKSYPGKSIDFAINSLTREGFDALIDHIASLLPEWPYLYDEDYYTDQSMDFRISEMIREVLFQELGDEIPYASYIEVSSIENEEWLLSVHAYIHTETESQKRILIGKNGIKITKIGTTARLALEPIFGKKVFLSLRVKVDKNWRKNTKTLTKLFPKR